jgi:small subunit ribosomal protein S16
MLKIRLQRVGKTNDPYMRLIVTPHTHKAQTHKATEILGSYDIQKGEYKFDNDRIKYWIGVGAQVSPTVKNILIDNQLSRNEAIQEQINKVQQELEIK